MDKNGQLTFSDDPLLNGSNEVYQLIEDGKYNDAVLKLDRLLDIDHEYPGLIESYRIAKFWLNREDEINNLGNGKKRADFLMNEWETFDEYVHSKHMTETPAYKAAMKQVFFDASENYKLAFKKNEDATSNFDLLLNLGDCFLKLDEYKYTIDTLEYAKSSYNANARLLSILGEAYFHEGDLTKSLSYFREAFFIDPSEIDLTLLKAAPIVKLVEIIKSEKKEFNDIREWVPVYGFLNDIFYVRRNLNKHQVESIKKEIFNLEANYQRMDKEQINTTNIIPRLINKYIWMLDYYEFQEYSFENITDIRGRLIGIDKNLFTDFFKKSENK
ncbi:tetratricopeptide repeat protein [Spirochaetota bacterium]